MPRTLLNVGLAENVRRWRFSNLFEGEMEFSNSAGSTDTWVVVGKDVSVVELGNPAKYVKSENVKSPNWQPAAPKVR